MLSQNSLRISSSSKLNSESSEEEDKEEVLTPFYEAKRITALDLKIPNSAIRKIVIAQEEGRQLTIEIKLPLDDLTDLDKRRISAGFGIHVRGVWSYSSY